MDHEGEFVLVAQSSDIHSNFSQQLTILFAKKSAAFEWDEMTRTSDDGNGFSDLLRISVQTVY